MTEDYGFNKKGLEIWVNAKHCKEAELFYVERGVYGIEWMEPVSLDDVYESLVAQKENRPAWVKLTEWWYPIALLVLIVLVVLIVYGAR